MRSICGIGRVGLIKDVSHCVVDSSEADMLLAHPFMFKRCLSAILCAPDLVDIYHTIFLSCRKLVCGLGEIKLVGNAPTICDSCTE